MSMVSKMATMLRRFVFKLSILFVLLGVALVSGLILWQHGFRYWATAPAREFHLLVHLQRPQIDLSQLTSVEWDHLVLVRPGQSPCDLGYEPDGEESCQPLSANEAKVLLIQSGRITAEFPLDRRLIDLVKSEIPTKIRRSQAQIELTRSGEWPTAVLSSR